MLINYLKVGLRNLLKYKVFSFINVFGLAVAMSVCMLIILMLADQYRYDAFHEKKNRIYRILSDYEGSRQAYATSPFPLASTLKAEYPIIEDAVNLTPGVGGDVSYNQKLAEIRGYFADASFFNVFSFGLEKGNRDALTKPNSMVITSKVAGKLFGHEDPLGKVVEFSHRGLAFPLDADGVESPADDWGSFTITGVIDDTKYKSHLKFDVLVSFSSPVAGRQFEDLSNDWNWYFRTYTYALLKENMGAGDLSAALNGLVAKKYANATAEQVKGFKLIPQSLGDVQLGLMGNDTNNRLPLFGYYFLGILAVVIMMSACLNYTNLSIARALTRAKEIGVRKVTGARRKNLVVQFLSESVVTSLFALAMGILLLAFIGPAFKGLWVNKHLNFELPSTAGVYLVFTGFALLIGILAGAYPALYLSGYQPIHALKSLAGSAAGKLNLRKALGVSQFVISLFFITTSILIYSQFKYYLSFDYGFNSEGIVNIDLQGANHEKLANQLSSIPEVGFISACDIIPSAGRSNNTQLKRAGSNEEFREAGVLLTDEKFADNLGIELIAGRPLPAAGEMSGRMIVVNKAAVKDWGYNSPSDIIGEIFETRWGGENLEVVGVVEDFRYKLLINQHDIQPLVMRNQPDGFKYLNVQLSTRDAGAAIAKLEERWKTIDPVHPFKYQFFDDQLKATHQGILDVVAIMGFIAFLAIVIACLGLLGMATYTAERKTKEVAIRKVLGAKELAIALLLSRGFLRMLVISVVIGAPLSYFVNNLWLQGFPNRVEFGVGTVLSGTLVLLVLGLLTIGSQTIGASRKNPAESLKSD